MSMSGELGDALEIIRTVGELAERGEREKNRADGLAARNIALTKLIDSRLEIDLEEQKRGIQEKYGAGLEGRVRMLLHRIERALEEYDKPPNKEEAPEWVMAEILRGRR